MSEEKKLSFNDLLSGDVLVMHAERAKSITHMDMHELETELILLLTGSDVSHGAIFYGNEPEHLLIDDARKGVGKHKLTAEGENSTKWYVRRLKSETDLAPVLARADFYNNRKTAYDWELLVLVGLLLAYKKVTPDNDYYKALLKFLKKVVVALDQISHNADTDYFICSQFVATCFAEAGQNYELKFHDGNLQSSSSTQKNSLFEQLFSNFDGQTILQSETTEKQTAPEKFDLIALHHAVSEHDQKTEYQAPNFQLQNALKSTLIDLFKHFLRLHKTTFNLQTTDLDDPKNIISMINKLKVDFVTPADLKSHCTNLEAIGEIEFVYH